MNYLIVYNEVKVLSCTNFLPGSGVVAPPMGINIIINDLQTAKMMLDAAGITYDNIPELIN